MTETKMLVNDYLKELCVDYKIKVIWLEGLSPITPPCASYQTGKKSVIIMNPNWHNKNDFIFQLAHEISHIIRGDESDLCFYNTSYRNKASIEFQTNLEAIKLLIPFYCKETKKENANVYQFIESFGIPTHLSEVAQSQLIKYYEV